MFLRISQPLNMQATKPARSANSQPFMTILDNTRDLTANHQYTSCLFKKINDCDIISYHVTN